MHSASTGNVRYSEQETTRKIRILNYRKVPRTIGCLPVSPSTEVIGSQDGTSKAFVTLLINLNSNSLHTPQNKAW